MHRICRAATVGLITLAFAASARGQGNGEVGFVSVVTGNGAKRMPGETEFLDARFTYNAEFDLDNGIDYGDSIVTASDPASAVLVMPAFGTVAHVESASVLRIERLTDDTGVVPAGLVLSAGRAIVTHSQDGPRWLVVAARGNGAAAYVLLRTGSVLVEVGAGGVVFTVIDGEALFFPNDVPGRALIDASGDPVDPFGQTVRAGQRIGAGDTAPVDAAGADKSARARYESDVFAFALAHGGAWLVRAEQGDFTPVASEAGQAQRLLRAEMLPELKFDQPRAVFVAAAPRPATFQVVRAQGSPARELIQSGVPTSVVVGQRFRTSRVIGGRRGLRANQNVEQLIRLPGR
ncbi:MAG: hypothetical protein IID36_12650 [Planctomycetes bacterium]|nr:hypothetical protein [Planctomycetota bacterium]